MMVPKGRGSLSDALFGSMRAMDPHEAQVAHLAPDNDEDAQISLWALYELHYRGFDDVDPGLEWNPGLLAVRADLERRLEQRLRARFAPPAGSSPFAAALVDYIDHHDGPSLASYVHRSADREQALELLRIRSIYHLKEADPTTWVVPRLPVRAKAALMELQYDEYGSGDPNRLHAHLFARGMSACGLDPTYGAYIDDAPLEVLEQNNAMSLFGLHRRLRGAALGHLAAFEATSSLPSRRLASGLDRLGFPVETVDYYREHVEADAVHEQLAVRTICDALVQDEPRLEGDVFFGAFTCLDLEDRLAHRMIVQWSS